MKKFRILACTLLVTGFGLTSCSSDDDNGDVNNDVEIAGTYNLTSVITAEPTDFNDDGSSNENQMEESDCYNNSRIVLNSDNSFEYQKNTIIVNEDDGTSGWTEGSFGGTWELLSSSGSDAIIRATYENNNGNDVTINLVKEGNIITFTDAFASYPDRDDNGGAVYVIGTVEYVFVK